TFGSSVFAGATAILRYLVGQSHAETILLSGDMYSAERALELGLIDGVVAADDLAGQAHDVAALLASKHGPAFAAIKGLLREPVVAGFADLEEESIQQFNAIWYSAVLRENLKGIKID
ncbi:MAG: enoyl-CoA hydratase/isomerase family protein, partial [candidate division Zixibacteria bacterium]|nr:enoyl-CoA hydratase/isomerase family protein [candidate division Zixibacteria bacterium]